MPPNRYQPKFEQFKQELRDEIRRKKLKPGVRLATFRQLMEQTGLSYSTVARALGDLRNEGVLNIRHGQGIFVARKQISGAAKHERSGRTGLIGIVVPSSAVFYPEVVRGAEDVCRAGGFSLLVASTDGEPDREADALKEFLDRNVDGLLIRPPYTGYRFSAYGPVRKARKPFVFLDSAFQNDSDRVLGDNRAGARAAVEHLVRLGHTRIAFAGHSRGFIVLEERLEGYRSALRDAGIRPRKEWVLNREERDEARLIPRVPKSVTAYVCASDRQGRCLFAALRAKGLRIPEDVSVVGYDDDPYAAYLDPALTTLRRKKHEMGARAADILVRRLDGKLKSGKGQCVILKPELVVRDSTGAVRT